MMRTAMIVSVLLLVGVARAERAPEPPHKAIAVDLITTPPLAPHIERFSIQIEPESSGRAPVVSLTFVPRDVSPETTGYELSIIDAAGTQALTLPRDETYLYRPELRVMKQRLRVEVRAIDAYGARSAATHVDVDVQQHYRCGLGPMIFFVIRMFVALLLVVGVVGFIWARRWYARRDAAEAVSPFVDG
jgi:hypothetical protein